jgi:hypothetical protein
MRRVKKWFVVAVSVWLLFGLIIAVARLARGEGRFVYRARFTEFFVCEGPDPVTGLPQEPLARVTSGVETLYACGYLEADGSVPLYFLLFHEGDATGWFDQVTQYQTGYVFKELPEQWLAPGVNRVEVYLQRRLLASEEFTVLRSQAFVDNR